MNSDIIIEKNHLSIHKIIQKNYDWTLEKKLEQIEIDR